MVGLPTVVVQLRLSSLFVFLRKEKMGLGIGS
jgi:hypothetical protein